MIGQVAKRSMVFVAMAAALVFVGSAAPSAPAPPADEATAYQLDATHDGSIADAGLTAPLTQAWSIALPGASYSLIADGMVFVTSTNNNTLYALNQATGATIWSHPLGSIGGLTYDRGRLFMVNSSGLLTAFDAATGAIAWTNKLSQSSFTSPPTALNGIVYILGAGSGGTVYAVQESTGQLLWAQGIGWGGSGSAAVTAYGVYLTIGSQLALDFDPLSGALLWHTNATGSGGFGTTPVVASGHLLMRDTQGNLSLDPSTGAVQGSFPGSSTVVYASNIPAVANDVAYRITGQPSNTVLSAVAGSGLGATNWMFNSDGQLSTAPIVAGGLVFVGSATKNLYALDASTGATTWSTNIGSSPTSLAASNGTLVVATGGTLMAYRTGGAITDAPSNQSPPSVAGATNLHEIEAADVGVWSGLPSTYAYQWERCDASGANCADIVGATGVSYVSSADDYGATLRVTVAATNGVGTSDPVESAATAVLGLATAPPALSAAPVLIGTAAVGQPVSTTNGTWTNSPTSFAYQWQRCDNNGSNCVDISGATSSQYTPVQGDVGSTVRSEVRASNNIGPAPAGYASSPPSDVVTAANPAPVDQATAYQLDPKHDGSIGDAGLAAPLTQAWSASLPDAPSSSLIAGGRVFVTANKTLYALNQATGATIWTHPLGGNGALAYDRGRIFVSSGSFYSGLLTAYNAATGSTVWTEQPPGQASFGPPTALNGIIYLGAVVPGAFVDAIRETDGTLLWTRSVPEFTGYGVPAPAVTAHGVYVGPYDFDPLLGTQRWHQTSSLGGGGTDVPVVASGYVYVGSVVLSPSTGAIEGSFNAPSAGYATSVPVVANGVAYLIHGSTLSAVDSAGLGSTEWSFAGDGALDTAPIVAGGLVFVGSSTGNLYALDAATGATSWSTNVSSSVPGAHPLTGLSASNGTLIVSAGKNLVAYTTSGALANAPLNQSPPTIDGSADLNEEKAADVGIWSGLPSAYTYQWELCDAAGANCADIAGATSPSYVPGPVAYGQTLRVRLVASNGVGSSDPVESAASAVLGLSTAAPVFSTSPVVTGTATVGEQLSTTNGTWTNSATSYAYQWQRCDDTGSNCAAIPGATSSQYTPVADDIGSEIRSEVLASNAIGPASSGFARSAATGVVDEIGAPAIVTPPADEATAYQLDATHDGYMADAGLSGPLTQAWSRSFKGFVGYPVVAQGMVFVAGPILVGGKLVDTVYALNQATGSVVWSKPTNGQPNTAVGLAYDRGRLFFADEDSGLTAFDAATGAIAWSVQIGLQSPPTATNGIVYTSSGSVYALRESAGEVSVGTAGSMPVGTYVTQIPVPGGTTAAISNGDFIIVTQGAAQETFTAAGNVGVGKYVIPVVVQHVGDTSFTGGTIFDVSNLLWQQPVIGGDNSAPAVTAQGVYVSYDCPQVYDFDPLVGTLLWHDGPSCEGGGGETPVVADGHVFVRDIGGNVILSPSTGAVQGSFNGNHSPAFADGVAFMLADSRLSAIDAAGFGSLSWSVPADSGNVVASPIVVGGVLYAGSAAPNAKLSALDPATGATLWSMSAGSPEYLAAANGTLVATSNPDTSDGSVTVYRNAGAITDPPSNQASPTVQGPADLSGLEAADVGVWSGLPNAYSYQWELCDGAGANCADIAGATGSSYLPPAAEVGVGATLRVRVAATNGVGSSAPVESAPSASSPLLHVTSSSAQRRFVTRGAALGRQVFIGQKLSTTHGIWTNVPTSYVYRWQRCDSNGLHCADIAGATGSQYSVGSADVGHEIRSEVRATNAVGPASTYVPSAPSTPVSGLRRPAFSSSPVVSGRAGVGSQLSTTAGSWTNAPTAFLYRWQRCTNTGSSCVNIPNATRAHYTLVAADVGHKIRSEVLAQNAAGAAASGYAPSAPTGVVGYPPAVSTLPKVSGTAKVGKSLAVTKGVWKYAPTQYAFQWLRCSALGTSCKKIVGATKSSYLLRAADVGHKLKATVTASNAAGSVTVATSNTSATVKP